MGSKSKYKSIKFWRSLGFYILIIFGAGATRSIDTWWADGIFWVCIAAFTPFFILLWIAVKEEWVRQKAEKEKSDEQE